MEKKDKTNKIKKNKRKYNLLTLVLISIVTFVIGGVGTFYYMNQKLEAATETNQAMNKIETVYSALYNGYYKTVSKQKLVNGALTGMVNSLGDPFTDYMSKSETESLNNTISSSFTGIGAEVQKRATIFKLLHQFKERQLKKLGYKLMILF